MTEVKQATLAHVITCGAEAISATSQLKYSNKAFFSLSMAVAHFDSMPDTGYVRAPVVLALFGISKATLWRWIKLSRIPAPKTVGRSSLFQVGQLRACLENLQSSGQTVTQEGGE